MKRNLSITLIVIASVFGAQAGKLHKLHFTKTNFVIYEDLTTVPACEHSSPIGSTNVLQTNTQTHYLGHYWEIESSPDGAMLYYDGNGAGRLFTQSFGGVQYFQIPSDGYFGFCIDNSGQGWLLTQWRDGDSNSYLWKLNLATAECSYVDVVDFGDPNLVTGMYMIEGPL